MNYSKAYLQFVGVILNPTSSPNLLAILLVLIHINLFLYILLFKQDHLNAMNADHAREEISIRARLQSLETSLKELKRVISDLKAKANFVNDLVNLVIKATIDNDLNIDHATMVLLDEATKAFTDALNESQSGGSRCTAAGNGGDQGSSSDNN